MVRAGTTRIMPFLSRAQFRPDEVFWSLGSVVASPYWTATCITVAIMPSLIQVSMRIRGKKMFQLGIPYRKGMNGE